MIGSWWSKGGAKRPRPEGRKEERTSRILPRPVNRTTEAGRRPSTVATRLAPGGSARTLERGGRNTKVSTARRTRGALARLGESVSRRMAVRTKNRDRPELSPSAAPPSATTVRAVPSSSREVGKAAVRESKPRSGLFPWRLPRVVRLPASGSGTAAEGSRSRRREASPPTRGPALPVGAGAKRAGPARVVLPQTKGRLELVTGLFFLAFAILAIRAVDLAILQGKTLKARAEDQHKRKVEVPATRGRFLDRNGVPLAISLPVKALVLDFDRVETAHLAPLSAKLAPLIGLPPAKLLKRLQGMRPGSYPILKRKIHPDVVKKIVDLDEPALYFTPEVQRFYPLGEIASHVLGFTDIDDRGIEGLERTYERQVRGIPGLQRISRDRKGRLMPEAQTIRPAKPGTDIVLTIDGTIQYIAYRSLLKGVSRSHAKAGSVIVLDPNNGHILAMANQPGYNPNHLQGSANDARRNRVITDTYEPGSTFKTFTVATALDLGLVHPDTVLDCENGVFAVGNRIIRDHKKLGKCSTRLIVEQSSNIGAAKIGLMTGEARQRSYLTAFGFGKPTGVDLGGEVSGSVPNIRHYEQVGLANRSFGQGIAVTPLQLTNATAAAVNDGLLYRPRLVLRLESESRTTVDLESKPTRVIKPQASQVLRDLLMGVVGPTGTASKAAVAGYTVAGKTGTAQKAVKGGYAADLFYSSFVGFVPADKPRLVIFVGIDEPQGEHYGGQLAAPVFREIVQEVMPMLGVLPTAAQRIELPPELPELAAPVGEDLTNQSLAVALEHLIGRGISPRVKGSGRVQRQTEEGRRLVLE